MTSSRRRSSCSSSASAWSNDVRVCSSSESASPEERRSSDDRVAGGADALLDRTGAAGAPRGHVDRRGGALVGEAAHHPCRAVLERHGLLDAVELGGVPGLLHDPQDAEGQDEERRHQQDRGELDRQAPVAQRQALRPVTAGGAVRTGATVARVVVPDGGPVRASLGGGHGRVLPVPPVGRTSPDPPPRRRPAWSTLGDQRWSTVAAVRIERWHTGDTATSRGHTSVRRSGNEANGRIRVVRRPGRSARGPRGRSSLVTGPGTAP